MTGEITLRGKVLPIGGVKEKLLAAHRAGLSNIVLPKDNEKDLADIPANVLDQLKIYMVETMDEVLKIALAEPLRPLRHQRPRRRQSPRSETTRLRTEIGLQTSGYGLREVRLSGQCAVPVACSP